jgi:NitT/TauT family transport system substrate-binding protein
MAAAVTLRFLVLNGGVIMRWMIRGRIASTVMALALLGVMGLAPRPGLAREMREMLLAEPVHTVGLLPIYVVVRKGFDKDEGIDLTITAMSQPGFVNAVLSGQAFAFIGSVDHNAFAKVNGKSLIAVSNLAARANIYLVARADLMPVTGDIASFLKGKRIAVSAYGGTPNNVLRYLLGKWKLEPGRDVTLVEVANFSIVSATIKARQADIGVTAEPAISQLYSQGVWSQPIFDIARELGPYTDTAVTVRADTIEKEPALVQGLVKAVVRALVYTDTHRDEMLAFAKSEFPTASQEDLEASLRRSFADGIYSKDGFIPRDAWATGEAVVLQAGLLKQPVGYDEVIDMRFVTEAQKELNIK